jgi:cell shape-determining protein MreC
MCVRKIELMTDEDEYECGYDAGRENGEREVGELRAALAEIERLACEALGRPVPGALADHALTREVAREFRQDAEESRRLEAEVKQLREEAETLRRLLREAYARIEQAGEIV